MGLDLRLGIDQWGTDPYLDANSIRVDRSGELFEAIRMLQPSPYGCTAKVYDDEKGLVETSKDDLDQPITYLSAGSFRRISVYLIHNLSLWNQAILAFLKTLPPDTRVFLWWS